jgi:stage V sporulation protein B
MLVMYYRFQGRRSSLPSAQDAALPEAKQVLKRIFNLALPVTIGALILPLMRIIDAAMITRRLEVAGFNLETATGLYGQFNGMAMTLVRFPTIIAASLAVNLVPLISEGHALARDKLLKRRIAQAFKLTLYVSIPAAAGLFVLAEPLCRVIFAEPTAAISLRYVAFGVVAVSLQQITASILQGFDRPKLAARNLFLGACVNALLNYTLTALPALGIRGAALGTVTGFTLAAALNIINVFQITKPDFDYNSLLVKPLFSCGLMAGLVYFSYEELNRLFAWKVGSTLTAVLVGVISYGLLLLITGGLTSSDIKLIPTIGPRLAAVLKKWGLLRS